MSNAPVDIDSILVAAYVADMPAFASKLREIHGAMAELIEADREYDEAERYFYDPSVKGVELVKAQERLRTATQRRRAALARAQGGLV